MWFLFKIFVGKPWRYIKPTRRTVEFQKHRSLKPDENGVYAKEHLSFSVKEMNDESS